MADTGEVTEIGGGYTFFWSGKSQVEPGESGVGFAIRTLLVRKLETLPRGINDRLMVMRLPLKGNTQLTLISAYAPTMSYAQEQKEEFYEKLAHLLHTVPKHDKLLLMGDFNARVGSDSEAWPGHIKRKHQDWFDNNNEEITSLLKKKQEAFTQWLNDKNSTAKHDHIKHLRSKVQVELRKMKNKWWESKAAELQQFADEHNTGKFFAGLKAVYGPSSNAMAPVRSADGTLLTEKSDITERWRQHFSQLLNRSTLHH
ncbi:uncharacterized protein LOC118422260 [Branchiostoma floridae]|uniref:Uncharacterized protein LOC118422260 n=1 Tax=Branchiostoma floridae TaxID=7739 RepID=A0A9J7LMM3_BRAFL|nr:uncharacterized protein LOC118422260 [Branchiostoma floridae]